MDSLQGYLFRRGIRILPIFNGEYTTEEDSDEEYRDNWMDYEEYRYEGSGQEEEFQRIPVRITDDRRSGSNCNLYDGNHDEGIHNGEDQQESRKGSTFAGLEGPKIPVSPWVTKKFNYSRRGGTTRKDQAKLTWIPKPKLRHQHHS